MQTKHYFISASLGFRNLAKMSKDLSKRKRKGKCLDRKSTAITENASGKKLCSSDIRRNFTITKRKQPDKVVVQKQQQIQKSNSQSAQHSSQEDVYKDFCYLTEEKRKLCFQQLVQVNALLKEELDEYKLLLGNKFQEIGYIEGEKEALDSDENTTFDLYPEREYIAGCPRQMHFRLAESQFLRLYSEEDEGSFSVTKVEYVVNPVLNKRFREAQARIGATRGEDYSHPVLAFHGTSEESMRSIVNMGFRMPGEPDFKQANDSGWYGSGIYLSEYPSYAREYMRRGGESSKLLLCQVLVGKVFHCNQRIDGEGLQEGFDSHLSPEMHQIIVFNSDHVLPCYIVHFEECNGDYRYS